MADSWLLCGLHGFINSGQLGAAVAGKPHTKLEKLFWIDLEMTGLDVDKEVIIECAVVITDTHFKEIDRFETVVKQPQSYLDAMDEWNRTHHGESGLTAKVPFGMSPEDTENHLMTLVKKHFKNDDRPILAGNSIAQDRLFIDKYWPGFAALLHYRMLDVSSWKIVFHSMYGVKHDKKNSHRALDDIFESISELRHYMSFLDQKKLANPN